MPHKPEREGLTMDLTDITWEPSDEQLRALMEEGFRDVFRQHADAIDEIHRLVKLRDKTQVEGGVGKPRSPGGGN